MTRLTTQETGTSWPFGRAVTLRGWVAERRRAEGALVTERLQRVLLTSDRPGEGVLLHTLPRAVSAFRARLGRAIEGHAARVDPRGRTAPSGPDARLVCCA